MPPTQPPKDCLGNELHEGDIVSIHPDRHLIMRILKLDNGGIETPQGQTLAVIVVGVTLTIRAVPGANIQNILRTVAPGNEKLISDLLQ